jgi:hypothetical protein
MKTLALALLLAGPAPAATSSPPVAASSAPAQAGELPSATLESARIRLQAQDAAGALADAEAALAKKADADAYATRGAAKLAVGRPMEEVIADYAEASKRDPRYLERYKGLIVQRDSERNPRSKKTGGTEIDPGTNNLALILGFTMIGVLFAVAAFVLYRGREKPVSAPEDVEKAEKKEPPEAS